MSGNLRQRLARIRDSRAEAETASAGQRTNGPGKRIDASKILGDSWSAAAEGVQEREIRFSLPEGFAGQGISPRIFSRSQPLEPLHPGKVVFFDLETTGLSGGTGTVAFLAAIGRYDSGSRFVVRQFFMEDYPYEPEFLACVEDGFADALAVVTYNGSSFDMPLYSTRRSMNRLACARTIMHLDALHASRRLWRRSLGDCSLQNLEAAVLGERRDDDIPGSEIPSVWFDFLKHGSLARLGKVFEHNARDIASLGSIFFAIGNIVHGGPIRSRYDPVGLAELQSRVDACRAEATLRSALDAGDRRAARPLMRLLRGQGRRAERAAIVPLLPDDAAGLFSKSVYAERMEGDLSLAVEYARRAVFEAKAGSGLSDRARRREERLVRYQAG
jgi:uncharacterized protein YprB with RNaseH-like and TPR domain